MTSFLSALVLMLICLDNLTNLKKSAKVAADSTKPAWADGDINI